MLQYNTFYALHNLYYILKDNFEAINWENVSNGEPSFKTGSSVNSPRSTTLSRNFDPILSATFDSKFS